MQVLIDNKPYEVGLQWHIAISKEDLNDIRKAIKEEKKHFRQYRVDNDRYLIAVSDSPIQFQPLASYFIDKPSAIYMYKDGDNLWLLIKNTDGIVLDDYGKYEEVLRRNEIEISRSASSLNTIEEDIIEVKEIIEKEKAAKESFKFEKIDKKYIVIGILIVVLMLLFLMRNAIIDFIEYDIMHKPRPVAHPMQPMRPAPPPIPTVNFGMDNSFEQCYSKWLLLAVAYNYTQPCNIFNPQYTSPANDINPHGLPIESCKKAVFDLLDIAYVSKLKINYSQGQEYQGYMAIPFTVDGAIYLPIMKLFDKFVYTQKSANIQGTVDDPKVSIQGTLLCKDENAKYVPMPANTQPNNIPPNSMPNPMMNKR